MPLSRVIIAVAGVLSRVSGVALPDTAVGHIVVFREGTTRDDRLEHLVAVRRKGVTIETRHEYSIGPFQGYHAVFSDAQLDALHARPEVAYIEKNVPMFKKETFQREEQTEPSAAACAVQSVVPSWGLARTSQVTLPVTGDYKYEDDAGKDADVYVLDTGVRVTHKEFEGRARFAFNAGGGKSTRTTTVMAPTWRALPEQRLTAFARNATSSVSRCLQTMWTPLRQLSFLELTTLPTIMIQSEKMSLTCPLGAHQAKRQMQWTLL